MLRCFMYLYNEYFFKLLVQFAHTFLKMEDFYL